MGWESGDKLREEEEENISPSRIMTSPQARGIGLVAPA